jgi:hypothetical protein
VTEAGIVAETEVRRRGWPCGVEIQQTAPVVYHGIWDADTGDPDVKISKVR